MGALRVEARPQGAPEVPGRAITLGPGVPEAQPAAGTEFRELLPGRGCRHPAQVARLPQHAAVSALALAMGGRVLAAARTHARPALRLDRAEPFSLVWSA